MIADFMKVKYVEIVEAPGSAVAVYAPLTNRPWIWQIYDLFENCLHFYILGKNLHFMYKLMTGVRQ